VTAAARLLPLDAEPTPAAFDELAPDAHKALRSLDGALWLEPELRLLVQMRTAQLDGSSDRLAGHVREAILLGETHRRLTQLDQWRRSPLFTEQERAALALAEAVAVPLSRRATAAARSRAVPHFNKQELAQLVFACAVTAVWGRLELIERSQT
jgi:alkylhydroperoxidase family enzyme